MGSLGLIYLWNFAMTIRSSMVKVVFSHASDCVVVGPIPFSNYLNLTFSQQQYLMNGTILAIRPGPDLQVLTILSF